MKRIIKLSLLVVLASSIQLGCGSDVGGEPPLLAEGGKADLVRMGGPVRVMTWNIGRIYLDDMIVGWQSKASDAALPQVADTVRKWGVDLVVLQELADVTQLDYLLEVLGEPWRGQIAYDSYGRYTALLTRLPLKGFFLNETGTGRTMQGAIVYIGGKEVVAVAVHLDSSSAERRLKQVNQVRKDLAAHERVILAGDFNFDIDSAFLKSEDLQIYRRLTQQWQMVDAAKGFATSLLDQRLDYIFYRGAGLVDQKPAIVLEKRVSGGDHNAVIVKFELN